MKKLKKIKSPKELYEKVVLEDLLMWKDKTWEITCLDVIKNKELKGRWAVVDQGKGLCFAICDEGWQAWRIADLLNKYGVYMK